MIKNPVTGSIRNQVADRRPPVISPGRALPSKGAAIVRAKVIEVSGDGSAVLRLLPDGGNKGKSTGTLIKARSEVPLRKGETVYLEILRDKEDIQVKFAGDARVTPGSAKQDIPPKFGDMLVRLSESRLGISEARTLLNMLRSLPQNIKNAYPELRNLEKLLQDMTSLNSRLSASNSAGNLLDLTGRPGHPLPVRAGSIIRAEVVDTTKKGGVIIRLIVPDSKDGNPPGTLIRADSAVPLSKGQGLLLEVLGGGDKMKMRIAGFLQDRPEAPRQSIPARFLDMFAGFSESRLDNAEFRLLFNMLRALPQNIKMAIPEFQGLEKLMIDINQVDGKLLKAFVETSGVAFETRLKIAVLNDPGSLLRNLMALQDEGDLKALLMRLKNVLKDQGALDTLKQSGLGISKISGAVDRFIREIELFQITSRLNDMFYTFLPLLWDDLREGEFLFNKNRGSRRGSYSCDINLDLESLGRLSISVTILDRSFYVTFLTQRPEVADLVRSQRHLLEEGFASKGLSLKAININHKKEIIFGEAQRQGINVRI